MTSEPKAAVPQAYQFGPWQLSTQDQSLSRVDEDDASPKTLEPLIYDLLVYFVRNSGQIITRQTLVEEVWQLGFVDDNAINRAMSELRKVLKLPDNKQTYIKTHYRKGYSFLPEVISVTETSGITGKNSSTNNTIQSDVASSSELINDANTQPPRTFMGKPIWLGFTFFIFVFIFIAWGLSSTNLNSDAATKESPHNNNEAVIKTHPEQENIAAVASRIEVSWQEGLFFLPSFSPSQAFLAFSYRPSGERFMELRLKNLSNQREFSLIKEVGDVYPVSWYSDTVLVYRVLNTDTGSERCDYYSKDVTKADSTPRYLWNCNHSYTANAALINDQQTFLVKEYNYRNKSKAAAIYSVDLASRMKFQVTSPNITGTGDFYFSVSNSHTQFVFLRNTGTKVELFLSDVEGNEQQRLLNMDFTPGSITWSSDDKSLVWLDHRNWQLIKYDIESGQRTVKTFAPQGKINASYAVSVADFNRLAIANDYIDNDVYTLNLASDKRNFVPLANSSVREGQGLLFESNEDYLYTTLDGVQRIWQVSEGTRTPIYEMSDAKRHNIDLSSDDTKLMLYKADYVDELNLITKELITHSLPFSAYMVRYFSDTQWLVLYKGENDALLGLYDHTKRKLTPLVEKPVTSFVIVDDDSVVFSDNEEHINLIKVSTKETKRLFKVANLNPLRWTADAQSLYYIDRNNRIMKKSLHKDEDAEEFFITPGVSVVGMKVDNQLNEPYLILDTARLRSNFLYDIALSSQK